jgi:hypothetical protein
LQGEILPEIFDGIIRLNRRDIRFTSMLFCQVKLDAFTLNFRGIGSQSR